MCYDRNEQSAQVCGTHGVCELFSEISGNPLKEVEKKRSRLEQQTYRALRGWGEHDMIETIIKHIKLSPEIFKRLFYWKVRSIEGREYEDGFLYVVECLVGKYLIDTQWQLNTDRLAIRGNKLYFVPKLPNPLYSFSVTTVTKVKNQRHLNTILTERFL